MKPRLGAGGVALAVMVATGTGALAAPRCARPAEVTAIQVAAVQQQLMVAALTCHDVTSFNAFQTEYSKELRRSDWKLHRMFRRIFGSRGTSQYHAFKTRLANTSSMRSIRDNAAYCKEAQMVFAAALVPDKPTLANFVSGIAVHDSGPIDSCDMRVATSFSGVKAAPTVIPKPNPLRLAALQVTLVPVAVTPASPVPGMAAAAPAGAVASTQATTSAAQTPAPVQTAAKAADVKPAKSDAEKNSGWFSGLFD